MRDGTPSQGEAKEKPFREGKSLALSGLWGPSLKGQDTVRAILIRLIRYGLIGVALNCAGYLVYVVLTWLGLGPKTTMTALYVVGAAMGFVGNRRWAFDYRGGFYLSALRYGLAHACGFALNFSLLYILVDQMGYPHQVVQAAAIFIVAGFLFLCFNFFVFPSREQTRYLRKIL